VRARGFVLFVFALGCGGKKGDSSEPPPPPACAANEVEVAGACTPKFDECGANEVPMAGGGCRRVGVPSDGCAKGFSSDASGGCTAILPSEPCKFGMLALPGESTCRLVSPCAAGTWGDIATESSTVFVDATIGRDDGDGTQAKPMRTVTQGVNLARSRSNAIVAVGAGKYVENVRIDRPMRLRGRCPSMVEIAGDDASKEALSIEASVEVSGIAFSGPGVAITAFDAPKVRLERVWVHDALGGGIDVERPNVDTVVEIVDSLIEKTKAYGIFNVGAKTMIERVVVRDVSPLAGNEGEGILAIAELDKGPAPDTTVRASLVERTELAGIASFGGVATLEATLIRDTTPTKKPKTPSAGLLLGETDDRRRGDFHVTACTIERTGGGGIYVIDSNATIERTVVRDPLPFRDGAGGYGITFAEGTEATLATSVVERGLLTGIALIAAKATIVDGIVRDTALDSSGTGGIGVSALALSTTKTISNLTLKSSLVERCHMVSVFVAGSNGRVLDSLVRDTGTSTSGAFGDGISAISTVSDSLEVLPASIEVSRTVVTKSARGAFTLFGASGSVGSSLFTCNLHDIDLSKRYAAAGDAMRDYALDDLGKNRCGCETVALCRAASSNLDPIPTE